MHTMMNQTIAGKLFWRRLAGAVLIAVFSLSLVTVTPPALAYVDTFTAVSAGGFHSLAVKADGSLWTWGQNYYGQLGTGARSTSQSASTPIPEQIMQGVVSVSAGQYHSLALKEDGSLWAWGKNHFGEIGDGTYTGVQPGTNSYANNDRLTPVKIMDNVVFISAGDDHSMAIKRDGSLWAWGRNTDGQLGDGTIVNRPAPVRIMDDVTSVSAGSNHTMAVKTEGSLWVWGSNLRGQLGNGTTTTRLSPVRILNGVASVSAGRHHSMFIKVDGSLWAMGWNNNGQLGDGTRTDRLSPVKITENAVSLSTGSGHTMVVKTDGSLWAWGSNYSGQLGDGTTTTRRTPVRVFYEAAFVSVGSAHTFAIKPDGSLWAWGWNGNGQLGDLTSLSRGSPVRITAPEIRVLLDGRELEFDVPPRIINGRTLVPLRVIFEELGATLHWDNPTQTISARKNDTVIVLTVGSTSPTVNGQVVAIDQPAIAVDGRILVPLRFIAEAFSVRVGWDPDNWTVTITN